MTHHTNAKKHSAHNDFFHKPWVLFIMLCIGAFLLCVGILLFWLGTLKLPDLNAFDERKVAESTKIYDRTGEIVLYDIHKDISRTIVAGDEISVHAKNAIVAIEDDQFYQHNGVDIRATIRGITYTILIKLNLKNGNVQGGSTLTQQVVKNTLLTSNKQLSRKLKEWFLAVKLEKRLTKDEILTQYLNVAPYGGTIYGIEEASQSFFGKPASELTITESAYLAALPNAPTYYSPYGQNREKLEDRKNLVLRKMFDLGFIDETAYNTARNEEVVFRPQKEGSAKALHFVQYVRSYLEKKYGNDVVENGGLKVITTLDYKLQQVAEDSVRKNSEANETEWNAHNQGVIVIAPKTGEILTMVGSRDYFDTKHEGNFNVTLAKRQPGSSFKPFAYLTAIEKGYTDTTIIFDAQTQFSNACAATDFSNSNDPCYSPQNYDGKYLGPITFRNALAQSRNIPAVKVLYLAGIEDSLKTAKNMGISTLDRNANRYGLTLVLGGGEVSLLDMTSAYGVFANNGVRNDSISVLRVEDKSGNTLEELTPNPRQVVDQNAVAVVNSILSDNEARTPLFGAHSFLYFGDYPVAGKTGTTNNNKDAWLVGYTPTVAVGVWTGNNDNTPMKRGSSISGSTWREVMDAAIRTMPREYFTQPVEDPNFPNLKPVLRGIWQGGNATSIDSISGKLATEFTPPETLDYIVSGTPHTILHWINKNEPQGVAPSSPEEDSQYDHWEASMRAWLRVNMPSALSGSSAPIPTTYDDIHTQENVPNIHLSSSHLTITDPESSLNIEPAITAHYPIREVRFFLNGHYIGSTTTSPFDFTFTPSETGVALIEQNTLSLTVTDSVYNKGTLDVPLSLTY